MSDAEKWQWVDEDPIERLLGRRNSAIAADSPAPPPQTAHPPEPAITSVETAIAETAAAAPVMEATESSPAFDVAAGLEKAEKWSEAADAFRKMLETEPGRVDASIGLGACLLHLDKFPEALNCFEECLSSNADRERALLGKGVALQKLLRHEDADAVYRELLQTSPNSVDLLGNLVALSVARQDGKAVGEYSRRLLQIDARSKTALQGLATQALWNGDHTAAAGYCKRIVEVDPTSYEGWFNLGFAKQHKRPIAKAVRSIA